jgi:hypothetical protein
MRKHGCGNEEALPCMRSRGGVKDEALPSIFPFTKIRRKRYERSSI